MLQDPAGLLRRIAELEPLCADPGIRRAVERGDPFKVYRAIVRAWLLRRLPAHRETLRLLVGSRRAFARPLSGSPMLGTFNSFGATLLGSDEAEPDGTHIATHYLVILFAVPLFPLGAYLVAGGERKGLSSSWRIFARVPLAAATWAWSRGLALAAALAVAWAGFGAVHAARHHDLHVVNGLGLPITVTIGGATLALAAGQRQLVNLPVGSHAARVTAAGGALDPVQVDVAAGGETLIWDVAGAAPLLENLVEYRLTPAPKSGPPPQTVHCGREVLRLARVDHLFTDPPRQISMKAGEGPVVRRHVTVADTGDQPGWTACAQVLLGEDKAAEALAILERRGRLAPWSPRDGVMAMRVAGTLSPAEGERVARLAREAQPEDTLVARVYQDALLAAGKGEEVLTEYRRRAEAAPGSATAQYLVARLVRGGAQASMVEDLAARFPADPDVVRLTAAVRAERGAWREVDAAWRALAALSAEQSVQVLRDEATALVALGRRDEALAVLARTFEAVPAGLRDEPAVLYAQVAALARAPAPDALLKRLEQDEPARWLRVRAGLPDPGSAPVPFLAYLAAAPRDPVAAVQGAARLSAAEAGRLDPDVWALAWGEAVRTGSSAAADLLARHAHLNRADLERLARWVRGEPGPVPSGLSPVLRAAAELVRSRNPSLPAAERARLLAEARRDDHLATAVTRASVAWTGPDAAR